MTRGKKIALTLIAVPLLCLAFTMIGYFGMTIIEWRAPSTPVLDESLEIPANNWVVAFRILRLFFIFGGFIVVISAIICIPLGVFLVRREKRASVN